MTRYYFNTRDGAKIVRDEIGLELDGIEPARDEATRGLADFAKDAIPAPFGGSLQWSAETRPIGTFSGRLCHSRSRS